MNFKLLMKDCVSTMCAPFDADEKSISLVELHKGMLSAMNELLVMVSFWLLPEFNVYYFLEFFSHISVPCLDHGA